MICRAILVEKNSVEKSVFVSGELPGSYDGLHENPVCSQVNEKQGNFVFGYLSWL